MTALVLGSTGLIGKQLTQLLLQDSFYSKVKAISRTPLDFNHPKLENIIIDFEKIKDSKDQLKADAVFCCLGTTMKQAGSKEAFQKVDYDYPLAVAQIAKSQGTLQYLLVSALGANKNSFIYYNQIKGRVEEDVSSIGFEAFHIFRPSLLLGERKETRDGEDSIKMIYKFFGFLIPRKYKAIESIKVAKAMVYYGKQNGKGKFVHESKELQNF